jgi:hypothetical protein
MLHGCNVLGALQILNAGPAQQFSRNDPATNITEPPASKSRGGNVPNQSQPPQIDRAEHDIRVAGRYRLVFSISQSAGTFAWISAIRNDPALDEAMQQFVQRALADGQSRREIWKAGVPIELDHNSWDQKTIRLELASADFKQASLTVTVKGLSDTTSNGGFTTTLVSPNYLLKLLLV